MPQPTFKIDKALRACEKYHKELLPLWNEMYNRRLSNDEGIELIKKWVTWANARCVANGGHGIYKAPVK